jgi:GH35 family endo-1,4-beta-xylanase
LARAPRHWAHQADPRATLFLNDYNNEGVNAKSDAYYALVKQLKAQGVPVHGYGMTGMEPGARRLRSAAGPPESAHPAVQVRFCTVGGAVPEPRNPKVT